MNLWHSVVCCASIVLAICHFLAVPLRELKPIWCFQLATRLICCYRFSGSVHTPLDLTEDEWNSIVKTNLTGTWLVSKHVCKRMCDAKRSGSVINVASISGLNRGHLPGSLAYDATKVAVNTMTKVIFNAHLVNNGFLSVIVVIFFFSGQIGNALNRVGMEH